MNIESSMWVFTCVSCGGSTLFWCTALSGQVSSGGPGLSSVC